MKSVSIDKLHGSENSKRWKQTVEGVLMERRSVGAYEACTGLKRMLKNMKWEIAWHEKSLLEYWIIPCDILS